LVHPPLFYIKTKSIEFPKKILTTAQSAVFAH